MSTAVDQKHDEKSPPAVATKQQPSAIAVANKSEAISSNDAFPIIKAEISVPSQPFEIKIDTPTDVLAAVLTPIIVGLAAVIIAWQNQKNAIRSTESLQRLQLRSATANFRHSWSTDFRTFSAEFISCVTQLYYKKLDDPNYLESPASNDLHARKITAHASIRMMLDKGKPYTTELMDIMNDVHDALFDAHPINPKSPMNDLVRFTDKAQEVREIAWIDIKKDLHHR